MCFYFLDMIRNVRQNETVTLHSNLLHIQEKEAEEVVRLLESEFNREYPEYPYDPPPFHREAALWGAVVLYISSQLLLYRENTEHDLSGLLPACSFPVTAETILSSDLCLRFIPEVLKHLKAIDPEDALIPLLEQIMQTWHYSGIVYLDKYDDTDFSAIQSNDCLTQLYVDRIIENNKINLSTHPFLQKAVADSLGIFGPELWPRFIKKNIIHESTDRKTK